MDIPKYKEQDIDLLIPYARNSRTHSDAQVTKIASSIKEFGLSFIIFKCLFIWH